MSKVSIGLSVAAVLAIAAATQLGCNQCLGCGFHPEDEQMAEPDAGSVLCYVLNEQGRDGDIGPCPDAGTDADAE